MNSRVATDFPCVRKPDSYRSAVNVLTSNFISPLQVIQVYRNVGYPHEFQYLTGQTNAFSDNLPTLETLQWLQANDYILVASPPYELSIVQLVELDSTMFFQRNDGWFRDANVPFSKDVVPAGQWLMMSSKPYVNSRNKTLSNQLKVIAQKTPSDQLKHLAQEEYVPNAAVVSYVTLMYWKVWQKRMLEGVQVRTSSIAEAGHHVTVGLNDGHGMNIGRYGDGRRYGSVGIVTAVKSIKV